MPAGREDVHRGCGLAAAAGVGLDPQAHERLHGQQRAGVADEQRRARGAGTVVRRAALDHRAGILRGGDGGGGEHDDGRRKDRKARHAAGS